MRGKKISRLSRAAIKRTEHGQLLKLFFNFDMGFPSFINPRFVSFVVILIIVEF